MAEAATLVNKNHIELTNPLTRSVELFANDLETYGVVQPETVQAAIDEELTSAAEDIAKAKSDFGVVPRTYYQRRNDLVDIYGNSLTNIHEYGIKWCEEEYAAGKPGAEWELKRRQTEANNLKDLVAMEPGYLYIETSATPLDKPKHEQEAQGYNGMTFVRATAKENGGIISQRNIILPTSEPVFLLRIQSLLDVPIEERTINSQALLEMPLTRQMTFKELESLIGVAVLESMPDHAVVTMLQKSITARREAWEFVSSDEHEELWRELSEKITELASTHPNWWLNGMVKLRKGFLKEFRERYDGKVSSALYGDVIGTAAAKAVVDGDVFIVCGGVVETINPDSTDNDSLSTIAYKLRNEVKKSGSCSACGAKGKLYGCGVFCRACNGIWCDKFEKFGQQLTAKQIRYLRFAKFNNSIKSEEKLDIFSELSRYWQKLKQETEIKQLRREKEAALKAQKS